MRNTPHLPKYFKHKPKKVTLDTFCKYIESLENKWWKEKLKLQIKLEIQFDTKFTLFKNKIHIQIDNKIIKLEDMLEIVKIRLQGIEKDIND